MNEHASIDIQAGQLKAETIAWLTGHSLQMILGIGAGAVIVLLLLGVKWVGVRICGTDPDHVHWRTVLGRMLADTRLWFMIAFAARLVAGYTGAPPSVASTIEVFFVVAATLQVALWARELILGVIEHRAGGAEASSGLSSAIGIIRLLVSIAIFAIALVVVLDNLGVNVTGLVAGLGIGGIAIGLAAQGIFADLFAALAILFDRPFRRGDSIRWDTTSGTVEQIGLKSTRVRAITGEEVVISNKNLLDKELHNMARLNRRRIAQPFGLVYQTSPETCARIPDMVKEVVESCDKCSFLRCGMTGYGASSLDFSFEFDVKSEVWQKVFDARSQVLIALFKRFNEERIEFAYPTQVGYTAAPDGTLIMPYPPSAEGEKREGPGDAKEV
jgi:small-conductance mechanosensitive channel